MESFLDSKLNPLVALGKRGNLKGFVNKFNAEAELLDDVLEEGAAEQLAGPVDRVHDALARGGQLVSARSCVELAKGAQETWEGL